MSRPRLLDLFCGGGGASAGYARAGFDVTGVDCVFQPRYPFRFIQADALEYLEKHGHEYDAIAASPPCQGYLLGQLSNPNMPRLIGEVRRRVQATGKPYVIENVATARKEMESPIMLCGVSFGLKTFRHRLFESNVLLMAPPHSKHPETVPRAGRGCSESGYICVTGHYAGAEQARAAMGIDWMNRDELGEAIPPAYTFFIGRQIREQL